MNKENIQQDPSIGMQSSKTMKNISLVGYILGIGVLISDIIQVKLRQSI